MSCRNLVVFLAYFKVSTILTHIQSDTVLSDNVYMFLVLLCTWLVSSLALGSETLDTLLHRKPYSSMPLQVNTILYSPFIILAIFTGHSWSQ